MKTVFSTILLASIMSLSQAQKSSLELKLKEGQEFHQINQSKITLKKHTKNSETTFMVQRGTSFKVLSGYSTGYEMEVKFDSLKVEFEEGITLNSEVQNDNDAYSKILYNMTNTPFQITMTKKGRIIEVKHLDSLLENAFVQDLDITEHEMVGAKITMLYWFDKQDFITSVEIVTSCYPDRPVATGDRWLTESEIKYAAPIIRKSEFTYTSSDSSFDTVEGNSKIKAIDKEIVYGNEEIESVSLTYDMTGTMTSTMKLNKKSGLISEAQTQLELIGTITDGEENIIPTTILVDSKYTTK